MPFVLQSFEPLSVGIRRLLGEQLASVHRHLLSQNAQAGEGADPTFAIHEARKGLKRCRTLLRLLRRALGRDEAQALGGKLRDLGRLLSPYRDRHMLSEAVARLADKTAASPFAEALGPVRSALSEQDLLQPIPEEILRTLLPVLRSVAAVLETRLRELDEAELRSSLRAGLRRLFRRGRRAFRLAYREPTDAHFHEWRKRVKDVYYVGCLLHLSRPQKLAPWVDALDQLSDDLGDEHDLGILANVLQARTLGGVAAVALTLQLIARRREELRITSRLAGQALYRRSPAAMARMFTRGLRARQPQPLSRREPQSLG